PLSARCCGDGCERRCRAVFRFILYHIKGISMSHQQALTTRRKLLIGGLVAASLSLFGCGGESKDAPAAAGGAGPVAEQKLVIKVGHAATESNTGHKGL